jgi:hypothetical protein
MKLTEQQLRKIIKQAVKEHLAETTMSQGKVEGPLKEFVGHLNLAKKDLGMLFQQISDPTAEAQAQWLLNAVNTIIKKLDQMPKLTQDPWADPGHRRLTWPSSSLSSSSVS